ncbi:MAG: exosortase system-associated protein, TIGR04073 family [Candidatus Omnitrophica bacterium]|nr:exosortase system-associated protein, TIGR04073 family [Candidatus Omnitrophota bacterium]
MRKFLTVLLAIVLISAFTAAAFASERGTAVQEKLSRGAKNVALGWTEIPKNIVSTTKESNAVAGITVGTVKGVLQAFARTVSGLVDIVTFPIGRYDRPAVKPSMLQETAK